jgi:hypothetical protein
MMGEQEEARAAQGVAYVLLLLLLLLLRRCKKTEKVN